MALNILTLPALEDNYIYLLHDPATDWCGVIDPSVGDIPLKEAELRGWIIKTIFITHHHSDHVGGALEIEAETDAEIVGSAIDKKFLPMLSKTVQDGDNIRAGDLNFRVIATPGHTRGHVCYVEDREGVCFTGDHLFVLGCGRLFEGSYEEAWNSMLKLRQLPGHVRVYPAHEYSEANANFAIHIESENEALRAAYDEIRYLRKLDKPTVPTTIDRESIANPFMRADQVAMMRALNMMGKSPLEVFTHLRVMKDRF